MVFFFRKLLKVFTAKAHSTRTALSFNFGKLRGLVTFGNYSNLPLIRESYPIMAPLKFSDGRKALVYFLTLSNKKKKMVTPQENGKLVSIYGEVKVLLYQAWAIYTFGHISGKPLMKISL